MRLAGFVSTYISVCVGVKDTIKSRGKRENGLKHTRTHGHGGNKNMTLKKPLKFLFLMRLGLCSIILESNNAMSETFSCIEGQDLPKIKYQMVEQIGIVPCAHLCL